jgi:hypothetical protein
VIYVLKNICVQLQSATEAVKTIIDHMTNPQTTTHLQLEKGERKG